MPYLETAQQWLTQSTLLLQARPSTTRITTKYTIKPIPDPSNPDRSKPRKTKPSTTSSEPASVPTQAPEPIRAVLILKTYDPVSGTTLKYSTTKAAEVSRLIQILGRLARPMAGLPEVKEDVVMLDGGEGEGAHTPLVESAKPAQNVAGGGGKKKKGKGKK
ncbi:hypothetical protein D0Z07_4919 [Hyphodiscus hymeniophilus]|uniref:SRP9 domain-containing protein n=1 Tax=Hyphodiscus hymeniophilus TaxID=353542 RepID=A0A9P7AWR7_9HELO|nr:hypothetical protein D0Z07_4919 [Hyphodiscus hymeniophilus]